MTCPHCGRASEAGGRFCAGCGADLAPSSMGAPAPAGPPSGAWPVAPEPAGPPSGAWPVVPEPAGPPSGAWPVVPEPAGPPSGAWPVAPESVPPPPVVPQPWGAAPDAQPWPPAAGSPATHPGGYPTAAYPTAAHPGSPAWPDPVWAAAPGGPVPGPSEAGQPDPGGRRPRRRWLVPAVGGGVLVLAGGVAAGAILLSSSGASTPEAAVGDLAEAVSAEDPVGLVQTLEPSEFADLAEVYGRAARKADELGVGSVAEGDVLAGLDLSVDGLQTEVTMLGENVARVDVVRGNLAWRFSADKLDPQLRQALEEAGQDADATGSYDLTGLVADVDGREIAPFLMVVDNGDGWYVSPLYTIAEYAVQAAGLPPGDYARAGEEVPPGAGGRTPEDAVRTILDTLRDEGLVGAIRQGTDQAGGVFAVYQDALIQSIRQEEPAVDSWYADLDATTRVTELDDGRAEVALVSVVGTTSDGEDVDFDGACPSGEPSACFDAAGELLSIDDVHVVVEERDDQWVIDPLGTVWNYVGQAVDGLDEEAFVQALAESDLQELARPSGELRLDAATDVRFNDAGFAVYTFPAEEGEVYTAWVADGWADFSGSASSYDAAFPAAEARSSGELRLVVESDSGGAGSGTVLLRRLERVDVAWGDVAGGTLAPGGCVEHQLATGGSDAVHVAVDSAADLSRHQPHGQVDWRTDDDEGNEVFDTAGVDSFAYQLCNDGDDAAEYSLGALEYTAASGSSDSSGSSGNYSGTDSGLGSVDGAPSVDGYYDGSGSYHTVFVPAGEDVLVEVSMDGDLDLSVTAYVGDTSEYHDGGFDGDTESFVLYGGATDSYVDLELGLWSGSTASEGAYTVSVY